MVARQATSLQQACRSSAEISSKRRLVVPEEDRIHLHYVVDPVLNTVFHDQVRPVARRERKPCSGQKVHGLIEAQLQGDGQREDCLFAGLVSRVAADLGEELSVQVRPLLTLRICESPFIDHTQEHLLEGLLDIFDQIL